MKRVKLLSVLLSTVMVLSLPITAMATEVESNDVTPEIKDVVMTEKDAQDFWNEHPTNDLLPMVVEYVDESEIDPADIIDTSALDLEEEYSQYQASPWAKYSNDYFYHHATNESFKSWWIAMSKLCDDYLNGTETLDSKFTSFVTLEGINDIREVLNLVNTFRYSNPQYFFLYSGISYSGSAVAIMVYPEFVGDNLISAKNLFFGKVDSWLGEIKGTTTEEKVLNAHNYLCDHVTYNYGSLDEINSSAGDSQWTQSAYSTFVLNTTVCAGYSMGITLLNNALGVSTLGITGTTPGNHAWNEVCIGNDWYNLDATWDDSTTGFDYNYFVISDNLFRDHKADSAFEIYRPKCTSTANDMRINRSADPGPLFKGNSAIHTHQLEYHTQMDATCAYEGMRAYYACNGCGKMFLDKEAMIPTSLSELKIPTNPNLHEWRQCSDKRENCEILCSMMFQCNICNEIKYENLQPKSHNWVKNVVPGVNNCEKDHYDYIECSDCCQSKREWAPAKPHSYDAGTQLEAPGEKSEGLMLYRCKECGYEKKEAIMPLNPFDLSPEEQATTKRLNCQWFDKNQKSFWYEDGVRQGTVWDRNGVFGDGTNRGREICDLGTSAWYWLDAKYDGAKALNKEVWMPYIYQQEATWSDAEKWQNAQASGNMANQVYNAICLHGQPGAGKWVRYDAYGRMYKGWYTVEGEQAFIYPDQIGNTYYYDEKTGLMAKGWLEINGEHYYFDETTGVLR